MCFRNKTFAPWFCSLIKLVWNEGAKPGSKNVAKVCFRSKFSRVYRFSASFGDIIRQLVMRKSSIVILFKYTTKTTIYSVPEAFIEIIVNRCLVGTNSMQTEGLRHPKECFHTKKLPYANELWKMSQRSSANEHCTWEWPLRCTTCTNNGAKKDASSKQSQQTFYASSNVK